MCPIAYPQKPKRCVSGQNEIIYIYHFCRFNVRAPDVALRTGLAFIARVCQLPLECQRHNFIAEWRTIPTVVRVYAIRLASAHNMAIVLLRASNDGNGFTLKQGT